MANKFLQVTADGNTVKFILGNGKSLVCCADDLSEEMKFSAMMHGINQKVRDSAAGFSKDSDFGGALRAMTSTWETLCSGLWNAKGGASGESDLVQAIANLKGLAIEKAAEIIGGLDEDQLKALRGKPSVKAELLRIKAERAAKVAEAADDEDEDILDL